MPTCGDSGGVTASGKPCTRRVAEAGQRCTSHAREGRRVTLGDGTEVTVEAGVGEVSVSDGEQGVDVIGLLVRMGESEVSPEAARQYFPILELLPGEERPEPGETIKGVPVFCWVSQAAAGRALNVSGRHVQNLERRGLPHRGERASKRYPLPHLVVWAKEYHRAMGRDGHCDYLDFRVAWARHRLRVVEEEAA